MENLALQAIGICINYWIRDENKIYCELFSKKLENLMQHRNDVFVYKENLYNVRYRNKMIELAYKMSREYHIFGMCEICKEHVLIVMDCYGQDYYDHCLTCVCKKCGSYKCMFF